jgi:zinc transport system substrate-binding protein
MKFKSLLIFSLTSILLLTGCSKTQTDQSASTDQQVLVATSFYPLYDFATNVVGSTDSVISIIPNGAEPHDFEPTPQDLAKIYNAKLFIFNGAGMEPWAEKLAPELEAKGVKVLELADFVDLLPADHDKEAHSEDEHTDEHADDHGDFDPHFWLDPAIVAELTNQIATTLSEVDAEKQAVYTENAKKFVAELTELDGAYKASLASCQVKYTVTSHSAFNYLAERYGFQVESIAGISSDEEPSPARLAELTEFVKANNVKHILFETLVSPKLAETLAAEAGIKTLVFNPLEGLTKNQIEASENYITIMNQNLESLKTALNCQ